MPDFTGEREDDQQEGFDKGDPFADWSPSPIPMSPDGGVQPGYGLAAPEPVPAMDAANCICLRGPCRYYWHLSRPYDAGNPQGSLLTLPRQHHYSCTYGPQETDLGDTVIEECTAWDPLDQNEFRDRDYRRLQWHEKHGVEEEIDELPEE